MVIMAALLGPWSSSPAPRGGARGPRLPALLLVLLVFLAGGATTTAAAAVAAAETAETAEATAAAPKAPPRRALRQQSGFYHRVTDMAWRQTDFSVRHEQQTHLVLSAIRRKDGTAADAARVHTALLGSQGSDRIANVHTRNNLMMNLRRYAQPGQGGALGMVYRSIHPRTFVTGDKDTDFRTGAFSGVALREMRGAQARHEAGLAAPGRGRRGAPPSRVSAAYERAKRELTDVVPAGERREREEAGVGGGDAAVAPVADAAPPPPAAAAAAVAGAAPAKDAPAREG